MITWLFGFVILAAGVGAWLPLSPSSGDAAVLLAAGCLAATMVLRGHREEQPWLPGAAALALLTFSFPLGASVSLVALLLLAGVMTHEALITLRGIDEATKPRRLVILLALTVIGYWLLVIGNPNVPSLRVGLLGVRKSMFVFVGLALGAAWPRDWRLRRTADYVWMLLCLSLLISISLHLAAPRIEAGFARSADVYTDLYAGGTRLQGIFAGPFHASMAASFLVLAGLYRVSRAPGPARWLPLISFALGLVGLYLAQVRTGYLVTLIGIMWLIARSSRGGRIRALALVVTVVAGVVLWLSTSNGGISKIDPAAASLGGLGSDSRALGRVGTWQDAWHLFCMAPFTGWGAGSAGDTLDPYFVNGHHVTAHNAALKYMVEGGVIGLVLFVCCVLAVVWARPRPSPVWSLAMPATVVLVGFSLTGAGVEAIPVSVLLALLIGLSLAGVPQPWESRAERLPGAQILPHSTTEPARRSPSPPPLTPVSEP